ncbi:MAG: Lcl C-terminal domain-containing protein, partial [Planctomycetota bacterium]
GDKVVIDHATGLMWHQPGSDENIEWEDAQKWVRDLNSRGYSGYRDWRLPTVDEAASLLAPGKSNGLYIDPVFNNYQEWIWTGDEYGSEGAWGVYFGGGLVFWVNFSSEFYVRPVRSGK